MFRKIIIGIAVIFMMMELVAAATVRPSFIEVDHYGLVAADWMAIIAVTCAFIDNMGRFADRKMKDKTVRYNFAYLKSTILASVSVGLMALGMGIVDLGLHEILTAVSMGFGGNVLAKEGTRGLR